MTRDAMGQKRVMKWIASLVWLTGGAVLGLKSAELLLEAREMKPNGLGHWLGFVLGGAIGLVKARFLFSRSYKKNVARIDALAEPKLWLFFRPAFFPFLGAMILLGAFLSRVSQGDYTLLVMVGALDLSLCLALLLSFTANELWPGA